MNAREQLREERRRRKLDRWMMVITVSVGIATSIACSLIVTLLMRAR